MSATIAPGATIAGYRVEALVGRGGMGVVYRATDLRLERPVALKLIAPERAQDERFRGRFLKEPRLAAALDHPNVLPIYEAGDCDGQLYLAMRYVEGHDLKSLLERDRTLTPERTVAILAQVAGALDAAHRCGLVHRDVKPANFLVDEDGHAYLTDFGITKQVGSASTQTGDMVGTLDYLAPEQIRGEPVDGRTDAYALGCVLHACLTGTPPFHRHTQAETLWAHLEEEPPQVGGHPALDPVLRRALAKDRDGRFASCRELVDAASEALGLAAPAPSKRVGSTLVRRRRAILAAGLVVLAATAAAAILALTGGGESPAAAPVRNGVAAIDARGDRVASFIESGNAPSNIAVGEGGVWVLSAEDQTISRVDPRTMAVTSGIQARGTPTHIAAGLGALWIGNGGKGDNAGTTVSISRVDPRTGAVTHTARLPHAENGVRRAPFNWGFANIATGDGAVWALDPDRTIARIDPKTGRRVATIDVQAHGVAAGDAGVWTLGDGSVTQIDPRTNRPGQIIPLTSPAATAIAVGAGKVWVTAEQEGAVWQIDPGPNPVAKTIDVGVGVTYIAFGAGALWTANYLDSTVTRIEAATDKVTHIPVNAAQALAAGAGSAWVSSAAGTEAGALPASTCDDVVSGSARPDVLIASDLPLQGDGDTGQGGAGPRAMVDAIRFVLRQHQFKAGPFTVGYRSCDDSTAQTGAFENRRCAANANAYARAPKLVALIGPYNSDCAHVEIPTLNRAPGGPLAMIGPTTSSQGADARRRRPGNRRVPPRARGLLPHRGAQLRAPHARRRRARRRPSRAGQATGAPQRLRPRRRQRLLEDGSDQALPARRTQARPPRRRLRVVQPRNARPVRDRRKGRAVGRRGRGDRRRSVQRRRSRAQGAARASGSARHDPRQLLVHTGPCRAEVRRAGGARDLLRHQRPVARQCAANRRGPAVRAEHGPPGEAVPRGARGGPGHRARAERDRALRRHPRLRTESAANEQGPQRHPRQLRLRRQRRPHDRADPDRPHHRDQTTGRRAAGPIRGVGPRPHGRRASRARAVVLRRGPPDARQAGSGVPWPPGFASNGGHGFLPPRSIGRGAQQQAARLRPNLTHQRNRAHGHVELVEVPPSAMGPPLATPGTARLRLHVIAGSRHKSPPDDCSRRMRVRRSSYTRRSPWTTCESGDRSRAHALLRQAERPSDEAGLAHVVLV
jgi:hypothetical protein